MTRSATWNTTRRMLSDWWKFVFQRFVGVGVQIIALVVHVVRHRRRHHQLGAMNHGVPASIQCPLTVMNRYKFIKQIYDCKGIIPWEKIVTVRKGSTVFIKIVQKWNLHIKIFFLYFSYIYHLNIHYFHHLPVRCHCSFICFRLKFWHHVWIIKKQIFGKKLFLIFLPFWNQKIFEKYSFGAIYVMPQFLEPLSALKALRVCCWKFLWKELFCIWWKFADHPVLVVSVIFALILKFLRDENLPSKNQSIVDFNSPCTEWVN